MSPTAPRQYRPWTPDKLPYNWRMYPLPKIKPYTELRGMLLFALSKHPLSSPAIAYMNMVLTRVPDDMSGVFEYTHILDHFGWPHRIGKAVQGELYRAGLLRWVRQEVGPGPLQVQVSTLLAGEPAHE